MRLWRGAIAAAFILLSGTAWGQRVQFPSMVGGEATVQPALPSGSFGAPGATFTPPGATFNPPAATFSAPGATFAPPGATINGISAPPAFDPYAAPGAAPYSPYAPSPYAPTPGAAPYGSQPFAPGGGQPNSLYPNGLQSWEMPQTDFLSQIREPLRFVQEYRGRVTYLGDKNVSELGVLDVEVSATAAVPFRFSEQPLLITPGFAMHFFDGPRTIAPDFADLPPRTYDAFLDLGWQPQITPWLAANLGARVGAYSDFNTFTTRSIRVMGRGLGVVSVTPKLQIAAGVVYLDRVRVKLLPAGGFIYTPNSDTRLEILFPNPKLARRFTTVGSTDLWGYIAGEYGGGSWTAQRLNGGSDQFDYNDLRLIFGLESVGTRGVRGFFELGYVFDREIIYRSGNPDRFSPGDTFMLRSGLAY